MSLEETDMPRNAVDDDAQAKRDWISGKPVQEPKGQASTGPTQEHRQVDDDELDDALMDSFPASDPPSMTVPSKAGAPKKRQSC
jgi:hypothetical protein